MSAYEFTKHPNDIYPVIVTYTNDDGETEYTVASVSVVATNSAGTTVTSTVTDDEKLTYSGNQAAVWVRGGEDGQRYEITVTATMSTDEQLTKRLVMNVADQ